MEEFSQEDVSSLVNSMFHVSDFTKTEFSLEFKIEDLDFREKFEELARNTKSTRRSTLSSKATVFQVSDTTFKLLGLLIK